MSLIEFGRFAARKRERNRRTIAETLRGNVLGVQFLDYLFEQPVVTVRMVEKKLGCTFATANKLVEQFEQLAILKKVAHAAMRNRRFRYDPYLALFEESMPPSKKDEATVQIKGEKEKEKTS